MRPKYKAWRNALIPLLDAVDERVAATIAATQSMFQASNGLNVSYGADDNSKILALVHEALRLSLRRMYALQTNVMVYVSEKIISTSLNSSGLGNFENVKQRIGTLLHSDELPSFSPLSASFHPDNACAIYSSQSFLDQLGVVATVAVQNASASVLLIYDCAAQAGLWAVKLSRRAVLCQNDTDQPLDPVAKRAAEKELNLSLKDRTELTINSSFPLPAKAGTSFATTGELIAGSFVTLSRVDSSISGFVAKPLKVMSVEAYQLPQGKDMAIVLSTGACEVYIASVLAEYEQAPENQSFFHETHFDKWLNKNVVLCLDDSCNPEKDALHFNVNFRAKYEDTTAGKDWNVDIYGYLPVRCTFSHFYNQDGLNIQLHVAQSGGLTVTGHKLNAGVLGDILDSVTKIVDSKIDDLKGRITKQISADVPFLTFKNATGSDPYVKNGSLIVELEVH